MEPYQYQIQLKEITVYGYHGVYEQEQLIAAPFLVNLTCSLFKNVVVHQLDDSLNYEELFSIVKNHFGISHQLLETLAKDIVSEIKLRFANVEKVQISIFKKNAAIECLQGMVGISYEE